MRLDRDRARQLVGSARVAHLGTVGPGGRVDLVPITFALGSGAGGLAPDVLVTAVDHKPKTTLELQRLANIERSPQVTVLVDHYAEDWAALWWVRMRGTAVIHRHGPRWQAAVAALVDRYDQYREHPPGGPAIVVQVTDWSGWAASN